MFIRYVEENPIRSDEFYPYLDSYYNVLDSNLEPLNSRKIKAEGTRNQKQVQVSSVVATTEATNTQKYF